LHEISALKAIPEATFAVIERICGVGRNPYRDGGDDGRRATDYACGKLAVANMLKALRSAPMSRSSRSAPPDLPNSPTPQPAPKPET
jgi:hypothetical protein